MALIWKAKYCVIPSSSDSPAYKYPPNASHILENIIGIDPGYITLLEDGAFSMPTSNPTQGLPINSTTPEGARDAFNSIVGSDFNTLFAVPYTVNSFIDRLIESTPSLLTQCQVLRNVLVSNPRQYIPLIHIPALGRYLLFTSPGSSGLNGSVIIISDNDNIKLGYLETFYVASENHAAFLFCVGYDGTTESLLNPNNYRRVLQGWASNPLWTYSNAITPSRISDIKYLFTTYSPPDWGTPDNPYPDVAPSGPGDLPLGTFDDSSDPIPFPSLPTLSAADTGFTRIYNPTLSQVQDLARYLWTDNNLVGTLWNKIKQFFEDPMQSFIAFNLVPCSVPDGGVEEFQLLFIPTGVNLTTAATQFIDVDCGTCEIQRYYGSALDQTPYTKISCFLPYIGMVALDTDEVVGRTLQVKYRIDIVSGSCVAYIIVDGNCLYQYSGHCAITIPFASADFSRYVQAAISVAGTALGSVSPMIGSAINDILGIERAEQQTDFVVTKYYDKVETVRNPDTGRQITAGATHTTTRTVYPAEQTSTKASFAGLSPSNVSNTVGQVMSSKASIQHSGTFSGNSGYLGLRRPYLLITRPRMCLPENYQSLNGYPSMITMTLGECHGYTRVQQVQLTGMHATNPEQAEILELLKSGVVF